MHRIRTFFVTEKVRLAGILVAALAFRLPWLLTPGYDVRDYKVWARIVSETGVGGAYSAVSPPGLPWINYPPVYLYVLRATGRLYERLRPDGEWTDQTLAAMLKLSPVLAEITLGILLYCFLRGRTTRRIALAATAAYLFNPALIWNTAYWGGIDALHSLLLGAALFAAVAPGPALSWPLAVLAVGAKPLALPGALATLPSALRAGAPRRLVLAGGAAVAAGILLVAPIIIRGEFPEMVQAMTRNLGNQAVASANAHNLWWLLTRGDGWRSDTLDLLPGLSYRAAGLLLFAAVAAWALTGFWLRAGDAIAVCVTGAYLTYAFAALTTEAHENWSVALFAPLAAAAAISPRYRPLYLGLALTTLANLALHDPPLRALLGPGVDPSVRVLSVVNAAISCSLLVWWTGLLVRVEGFPVLPWRLPRARPAAGVKWSAR